MKKIIALALLLFSQDAWTGGVINGQPVNASVTNAAYLFKNADDSTPWNLGLSSTNVIDGSSIARLQRYLNSVSSYTGVSTSAVYNVLPAWTNNQVGASSNTLFTRSNLLTGLFDGTTGHMHTGSTGDGPLIPLGTSVTGTLKIPNGGTNSTTSTAGSIPNASSASVSTWTPIPTLGIAGTTTGTITLDSSNTIYTTLIEPAPSPSPNVTFQFPPTNGSSGQYLGTNGSGVTTWSAVTPTFSGLTTDGVMYATSSTAIGSTSAGTANYPLVANSSAAPTFQKLSLTAGVTGTLPIANGGTNATSTAAGAIPNSSSTSAASWTATPTLGVASTTTGTITLDSANTAYTTTIQPAPSPSPNVAFTLPPTNGTSGFYLKTDGTGVTSWASVAGATFTAPTVQVFNSGTGATYTAPIPAPLYIRVKVIAAGAGGGASGTTNGTAATDGGNSTFGTSLLTAPGGSHGARSSAGGVGGAAPTVNSPAIDIGSTTGSDGSASANEGAISTVSLAGASGGASGCGSGGTTGGAGAATGGGGTAAANSGGGGGGASSGGVNNSGAGSGGGGGSCVEAIIPSPSSTYLYTVGVGGSGQAAGTSGAAGGAGANGKIVVTEYYQ